jgi:hypothetical protein
MKILISIYRFVCPWCDAVVRKGESYVERDGCRICLKCGLPERRLKPLNTTI